MRRILLPALLLALFFSSKPLSSAERIDPSGKVGLGIWYEDYERKGLGGFGWFNSWLGVELLLNIDTTFFHDYAGYAGKIRFPVVVTRSDNVLFELCPSFFYRYDNRNRSYTSITTMSPGLWVIIEFFPFDYFKNTSFNIAGGFDYSFEEAVNLNSTTASSRQMSISVFSMGVRYYF